MTDQPSSTEEDGPRDSPHDATARERFRYVVRLMELHETAYTPKVFEVWNAYAQGIPAFVKQQIDHKLAEDGTIGTYDMEQIHASLVAATDPTRKLEEAVNQHLEHEMDNAINFMHQHATASDGRADSLTRVADTLAHSIPSGPSGLAIQTLLGELRAMRVETTKLTASLHSSRAKIRKLRASLAKSREREMLDPLTNLANRRHFETGLPRAVAGAHEKSAPLCLAMVDIDNFKQVNDRFGHVIGDDVLKHVASVLQQAVHAHELAARYGGEEFSLLLPGCDLKAARIRMEKLRAQIETEKLQVVAGKVPIKAITASFGVVQLRPDESAEEFLQRADVKLYEAKRAGRNCVSAAA